LTTQSDESYVLADASGNALRTCDAPNLGAGTITCTTDTAGNTLVIQLADGSSETTDSNGDVVETCTYSAGGIETCVAA